MKKFRVALALILGASLLAASGAQALELVPCNSPEDCDRNPAHLQQFVKKFYTWYIISEFENLGSFRERPVRNKLKEVLTKDFFRNLDNISEDRGDDPFVCAQDFYEGWFYPTVRVLSETNNEARFLVGLAIPTRSPHQVEAVLKASDKFWRLASIRCMD